jgi:hypothetical protein
MENEHIFDTNIWVNICIGNVLDRYLKHYGKLYVCEQVENEVAKWGTNGERYAFISGNFEKAKTDSGIEVLYLTDFEPLTQRIVKLQLQQYSFTAIDNSEKTIPDLGEYASAVYAAHKGIINFHSDDKKFCQKCNEQNLFEGLNILLLNEVLDTFLGDIERIRVMGLIEERNRAMSTEHNELVLLKNLITKFNNGRLTKF